MQKNRLGNFPTRFIIEPQKTSLVRLAFNFFIQNRLLRMEAKP
jgi:hypothetical protein